MAFVVRHCPDARLGIVELHGTVTGEQIAAGVSALYDTPHWDPSYDVLWDARRLSSLLLVPEDVAAISRARNRTSHLRPTSRVAVVVTRDLDAEISTLLLRSREADRAPGRVFRSLPAALEYLGREGALPPTPAPPPASAEGTRAGEAGRRGE